MKPATLLKVTFLHGSLSRFLNCTNSTKSCNASHMCGRSSDIFRILQHNRLWKRYSLLLSCFSILQRIFFLYHSQPFIIWSCSHNLIIWSWFFKENGVNIGAAGDLAQISHICSEFFEWYFLIALLFLNMERVVTLKMALKIMY